MQSKGYHRRKNQKNRRKPHRDVGVFQKDGVIRVVEPHPTKGFKEQNGERWRKDFEEALANDKPITLQRGKTKTVIQSVAVTNNKPKVTHRKSG